ncbi:MAG TPA: hypothetical protein VHV10_02900 [Ktedonobacteraceae bacterium]|nr:hypothetical protein [Ktedonobacteraceae bacterium]
MNSNLPMFGPPIWYLLDDDGNPYPTHDTIAAAELLGDVERRRIGQVEKEIAGHRVWLSTVFLVLEHMDWSYRPPRPALFETMLFIDGNEIGNVTNRYATSDEALQGHAVILEGVERLLLLLGKNNIEYEAVAGLLEGKHE